jgi:hypothetical protein
MTHDSLIATPKRSESARLGPEPRDFTRGKQNSLNLIAQYKVDLVQAAEGIKFRLHQPSYLADLTCPPYR